MEMFNIFAWGFVILILLSTVSLVLTAAMNVWKDRNWSSWKK